MAGAYNPKNPWGFKSYTPTIHRASYPAIDPKNPNNSAKGKVVVVTGGGIGVGKGIATSFVEAGAKAVVLVGRREQVLADTKAELEKLGSSKILTFKGDVVDEAALDAAFKQTEKEVGKIDVCVANAGYLPTPGPVTGADLDDWWKAFEINIKGTLLTFRAFNTYKSSNSPTFISLNTGAAHYAFFPGMSGYSVSKLGAAGLISFLQAENPDVRVVSQHPGVIQSEMNDKAAMPLEKDDSKLPADFSVWLASPAAAWAGGRFLWSNWDVEDLVKMKDDIVAKDDLRLDLRGFPAVDEPVNA